MQIPRKSTSTLYPDFIRDSEALQETYKADTIFPKIGLNNCTHKQKNVTIVFSGSGYKRLWDIATMSMRGVSSCQNWDDPFSRRLVGSMLDPYAGIVYTTTGFNTPLGINMVDRAVVRFVVSNRRKGPALLIEPIYGASVNDDDWDANDDDNGSVDIQNMFADFLRKKTKNKLHILHAHRLTGEYAIPLTQPVSEIRDDIRSYRDSGIPYRNVRKYYDVSKLKRV
jgi:hypothetical protein